MRSLNGSRTRLGTTLGRIADACESVPFLDRHLRRNPVEVLGAPTELRLSTSFLILIVRQNPIFLRSGLVIYDYVNAIWQLWIQAGAVYADGPTISAEISRVESKDEISVARRGNGFGGQHSAGNAAGVAAAAIHRGI